MTSFYHGSYIRYAIGNLGLGLRWVIKGLRSRLGGNGRGSDTDLADKIDTAIARRDWGSVAACVDEMVALAKDTANPQLMQKAGQAYERLGNLAGAAELRLAARHIRKGESAEDWAGEHLGADTLLIDLVEDDPRSLGRVIRHARLAGTAAARAEKATIRVEPRIVPLLQRTFPKIRVISAGEAATGQKFATFEHLAWVFGRNPAELAAGFMPLLADPRLVEDLRKKYRAMTDQPLVGLSWGSKSHTKDVPGFPDWAKFVAETPATFVSLQYGPIKPALRRLRKGNNARLIHDETVDQMVDMDRFAAQIVALDAVVTISNTAAHLAGALGVPTVFLIDDKFKTVWPVVGDRTPWYPSGIVLHKNGREWPAVLEEVGRRLSPILAKHSSGSSAGGCRE